MSRSDEPKLSETILAVMDSFFGVDGNYFGEIQDYPIAVKTKIRYLEKARDEDCHTFLDSLEKIYNPNLCNTAATRNAQLNFFRALKAINDICHNNEVKLGAAGVHRAVEHYFRGISKSPDIPKIQIAMKEMVSNCIAALKSNEIAEAEKELSYLIHLDWRQKNALDLPEDQKKSALLEARTKAYLVFNQYNIDPRDFINKIENTAIINDFVDCIDALEDQEKALFCRLAKYMIDAKQASLAEITQVSKVCQYFSEAQKTAFRAYTEEDVTATAIFNYVKNFPVDQLKWESLTQHRVANEDITNLITTLLQNPHFSCHVSPTEKYIDIKQMVEILVIKQQADINQVIAVVNIMNSSNDLYNWMMMDQMFDHPGQKRTIANLILENKDFQTAFELIARDHSVVSTVRIKLDERITTYINSIPEPSFSSNLFRNRERTDAKKALAEKLKEKIMGCVTISGINAAIQADIDTVNNLEKGVSPKVTTNQYEKCLADCMEMMTARPSITRVI